MTHPFELALRSNPFDPMFWDRRDALDEDSALALIALSDDTNFMDVVREMPLTPQQYQDLYSRQPEIDFVPDTIVDPVQRALARQVIKRREAKRIETRRGSTQLGQAVARLTAGQSAQLFYWEAEDHKPTWGNITLSYTQDLPFTGPDDAINLYAKVEWGSGGAVSSAWCDFNQGTQISVCGSFIRVSAINLFSNLTFPGSTFTTPDQSTSGLGPPITAIAHLGFGGRQFPNFPARFTRKLVMASGAVTSLDSIPPFATAFGYSSALTAAGQAPVAAPSFVFQLFQNNIAGNVAAAESFTSTLQITGDNAFAIPNGMRFLTATNNSGAPVFLNIYYGIMM